MRRRINSILISGISGLVSLLWLIPLVWLCTTAFTKPEYSMQLFLHTRPSLNNFKYVLDIIPFWRYFINTVEIVIFTFGIQFITVSMAAYALGVMRFRGEKLMFLLIFVQLTIPNDVLILANYKTLAAMHLTDTKLGIMLPYLGSAFGTFLVRQSFKTIPVSLSEAARMDGCTTWSNIWRIYVPCSKPAFVSMGLMSVSYHWNNYLWPMVVTSSVENRPLTVGLAIFAKSKESGTQWFYVCAATLMIIAPLVIGFFVFQRKFINSFVSSGIK